jgi:hypothetical protein
MYSVVPTSPDASNHLLNLLLLSWQFTLPLSDHQALSRSRRAHVPRFCYGALLLLAGGL